MDKPEIILGVRKACVVLHKMAFEFKNPQLRQETLSMVDCLAAAVDELKKMP